MSYQLGTLAPGIAGMHWLKADLGHIASEPILSMLELNFKDGIDINDATQPAHSLWTATLEFLCTLPNRTTFYYGQPLDSKNTILLLIQWDHARAWQVFEKSLGCTLLLSLLATNPFNRCLRLSSVDLGGSGGILVASSFVFEAQLPETVRKVFDDAWHHWVRDSKNSASLRFYGQWVEPNVPDRQTQEAKENAAAQPVVFIGLIAWTAQDFYDRGSRETGLSGADQFATRFMQSGLLKVSTVTSKLMKQLAAVAVADSNSTTAPPTIATSTESLLEIQPLRYFRDDSALDANLDTVAGASIFAVKSHQRRFPEPYGGHPPMGQINQDFMRSLRQHSQILRLHEPSDQTMVVEVLWLYFNSRKDKIQSMETAFLDLRMKIAKTGFCHLISWARVEDRPEMMAMLVVWKSVSSQLEALLVYQSLVTEFINALQPVMAQTPQRCDFRCNKSIRGQEFLELTMFDLPDNNITKQLFEEALFDFHQTIAVHSVPGGIPTAGTSFFGGWPVATTMTPDTTRFTALISWNDDGARKEWYESFSNAVRGYYERLGHRTDALRAFLTTGGKVQSMFLHVEPQDLEVSRVMPPEGVGAER